jgi:nucleotide-binding universal stress UspA family protein
MMFKTILVPVDISDEAAASPAIEYARQFAKAAGGSLRLINVRSLLPVSFMEFIPPDFDEKMQKDSEAALMSIASGIDLPKGKVSSIVRLGAVYPEVLAEAEACKADLIVVGSHRPGMASFFLGSNASTIVRHATCSVLVVR